VKIIRPTVFDAFPGSSVSSHTYVTSNITLLLVFSSIIEDGWPGTNRRKNVRKTVSLSLSKHLYHFIHSNTYSGRSSNCLLLDPHVSGFRKITYFSWQTYMRVFNFCKGQHLTYLL